jgi:hypothetical protein
MRFTTKLAVVSAFAIVVCAAGGLCSASEADGVIVSKRARLTEDFVFPGAGIDFFYSTLRLTLQIGSDSETITLEGPTEVHRGDPDPVTRLVETEIVSMQLTGQSILLGQALGLDPAPAPLVICEDPGSSSLGQIAPLGGGGDFPASSSFDVTLLIRTPMGVVTGQVELEAVIDQIPPYHSDYVGDIDPVDVDPDGDPAFGQIIGQVAFRPMKPAIPVNVDADFVVETVVSNYGPSGPEDFKLTVVAVAPPGCTITPSNSELLIEDLAVGEQRTVLETFTVNCSEAGQHDFPISNAITPASQDVTDPDPDNNVMTTELRVAAIAEVHDVAVDIKPQSCPNPLNPRAKGVLPVAILGTLDLDVTMIDPASVRLEGVEPLRWSIEDVATPGADGAEGCECTTEGPDGYDDLVLMFDVQAIVAALGEISDGETRLLSLTGDLAEEYDAAIEGGDCVIIRLRGASR